MALRKHELLSESHNAHPGFPLYSLWVIAAPEELNKKTIVIHLDWPLL